MGIDPTRGNQASLRWLLYDGHGNLVRTMAPDYTLSAFQWRGVWGEVQSVLGAGRGYYANLGHPEDETGLVYMRARYYEPATGRFISEDPARDGVNWYLYADGNPVGKVDGNGKNPLIEAIVFLFLVWWHEAVLNPMTWGRGWQPFLNILHGVGSGLVSGGVLAVAAGVALWYSTFAWGPTAKTGIAGRLNAVGLIKGGAIATVVGAFLLYSYWYGATIETHDEFQSDAGLLFAFLDTALSNLNQ